MPSAFASLMAGSALPSLLALHGVTALYQPAAGAARTVLVLFAREEQQTAGQDVETDEELAWVGCHRSAVDGIDQPRLGDVLRLADEPPESPWTFQGAVKDATETTWKLRFGRVRPRRYVRT